MDDRNGHFSVISDSLASVVQLANIGARARQHPNFGLRLIADSSQPVGQAHKQPPREEIDKASPCSWVGANRYRTKMRTIAAPATYRRTC